MYVYIHICIWLVVWNILNFPYIGNNDTNWLIFFRGVETTNQVYTQVIILHLHTHILSICCFFCVFSGLVILITIYFQRILIGIYIHEPDIYGYWFGFYIYTHMEYVCLYVDIFSDIYSDMYMYLYIHMLLLYIYLCFTYFYWDILWVNIYII